MSRPAEGNYVIYNRVLNASGDKLAITFNGPDNTLTVTRKSNSTNQIVCLLVSSLLLNFISDNDMIIVPTFQL